MTITPIAPLVPDRPVPLPSLAPIAPVSPIEQPDQPQGGFSGSGDSASAFARAVDAAGTVFDNADRAESAFTKGTGGLQEMVIERARADATLSIATTAVSRTAQAISTVMGMQI